MAVDWRLFIACFVLVIVSLVIFIPRQQSERLAIRPAPAQRFAGNEETSGDDANTWMLEFTPTLFLPQSTPYTAYTEATPPDELIYSEDTENNINKPMTRAQAGKLFPCPSSIGAKFNCQHYKPEWEGREDVGVVLAERMSKVRMRCELFHSSMFNSSLTKFGTVDNPPERHNYTRVMINPNLDLGFCWMAKMGSTFWKRAWRRLDEAPRDTDQRRIRRPRTRTYFLHLDELFLPSASKVPGVLKKIYKDMTLFTISRNPWQRIVSVFRQKCETRENYQCTLLFGRGKACPPIMQTLKIFVECLISTMSIEETEHYGHLAMTYQRCNLCEYPYKYVVAMENMSKETEYIFKQAGVKDPARVMSQVREETIREVEVENKAISYIDYWKQIPPDLIDKVRFYYRYEILLFDYPETPFYLDSES